MLLYLLRHGTTDWNISKRLQGNSNTELNEDGRKMARETAQGLSDIEFSVIYSSPLNRALETATIVKGSRNIPIIVDERLIEVSFGIDEGVYPENRTKGCHLFFDSPAEYVPAEGAESFESLLARTKDFIEKVLVPMSVEQPNATVLVSGHGAMNKAIFTNLCHNELKDFWAGKWQKNCSINIFEINGFEYRLLEEAKTYYES